MTSLSASLLLCLFAAAPSGPAARVAERAQALGLGAEATGRLLGAIEAARAEGLPAESVEDKVLEGLAKGVPAERIVTAAQDLHRRLGLAQQALKETSAKIDGPERRASLERLAASIRGDGQDVLAMARASKGAGAPALTAAARELAKLRSKGVESDASIPALAALARANQPEQIARVAALLEDYVREGGTDQGAFLVEVRERAEKHEALDDLVDHFGTQPDPLRRIGPSVRGRDSSPGRAKTADPGQPSLEREDRSGSVPGLDKESPARKAKCVAKKNKPPECE
ncbi:MAG TPA: hypothetical protein VGK67_26555 [Myxococcales bacterium]|jgi:hypothetical protein